MLGNLAARTWARWPVVPAFVLAVAVAVSLAHGQPPPADRASGVSVAVVGTAPTPAGLDALLVVAAGGLTRYDAATGQATGVALPPGEYALRAWPVGHTDVVLTVPAARVPPKGPAGDPGAVVPVPLGTAPPVSEPGAGRTRSRAPAPRRQEAPRPGPHPAGRPEAPRRADPLAGVPQTAAYALPPTGRPVRLGAASAVVPAAEPGRVWLLQRDIARLVGVDGRPTPARVRVPPGYWLVGATRDGLVATTRDPRPLTVLLPASGAPPRWVANAEALDVSGTTVLLRRPHQVGALELTTGRERWLPGLAAVELHGPGVLSPDERHFAVQARVNTHARVVVGPLEATSTDQLRVVALDGGPALADPPAPVWAGGDWMLAVRPDGRMVVYRPGDVYGSVLSASFEATGIVPTGP